MSKMFELLVSFSIVTTYKIERGRDLGAKSGDCLRIGGVGAKGNCKIEMWSRLEFI